MPKVFASFSNCSGRTSVAIICDGITVFAFSNPRISASPMFPAPRNAIVLFFRLMSFSFSEDGSTDAYHGRAFFDGDFKIVRHPHRKFPQAEGIAKLPQPAEVRPRFLHFVSDRRNSHQSLDLEAWQSVDLAESGLQIFGLQPKFARLARDIN